MPPARTTSARHDQLARVHRLTGLFPLAAFVVFHAWQQWPIRVGRDEALARMAETSHPWLEWLFVLLPLAAHAASGLWLRQRGHAAPGYASPAFRQFQAITGGLVAAFLGCHVLGVWLPSVLAGTPLEAHARLFDQTGSAPGIAGYALGISAVCLHLGQGLSVALLRAWPACPPRLAYTLGGMVGGCVWIVFLDELAAYATGAPLM
jgi:succinate dehydrogenase / fumarate reductase cytochrome b subunit